MRVICSRKISNKRTALQPPIALFSDEIQKRFYTPYSAQCFIGMNCTEFCFLFNWSVRYMFLSALPHRSFPYAKYHNIRTALCQESTFQPIPYCAFSPNRFASAALYFIEAPPVSFSAYPHTSSDPPHPGIPPPQADSIRWRN